ncbi:MAG: YCF48-related protein [Candidatus Thorarchaeota archaeon]|nr:YCF48-related protein [Candidatus Thorarchaeota archaeon]
MDGITISMPTRGRRTATMLFATLIILSHFVFFTSAQTTGQTDQIWVDQNSGYNQAIFWDIDFVNNTHGWVIGQSSDGLGNGIILSTVDGGDTWVTRFSDSSQWFNQLTISSPNSIWIAGMAILANSRDGGITWNYVEFENVTSLFTTVGFANSSHGWASTNQQLFRTFDAGVTWNVCTEWTYQDTIRRIYFHTPEIMDVIGFYGIYHSEDGGMSWQLVFDKGGWALAFASRNVGWAVADNMLAETRTATSWEETPVPSNSPIPGFRKPYLTDVQFIDDTTGWIVGSQTAVIHTVDGGISWYSQGVDIGLSRLMSVDFLNATHGWASGYNGRILHTERGDVLVSRLWRGMGDPVFLTIIGALSLVVVTVIGGVIYRKRKGESKPAQLEASEK